MSSIYRKGRDGYFYYQTYVVNPETGNKDKRIFHALRTKDRKEAEDKRVKLDAKYERSNTNKENLLHKSATIKRVKVLCMLIVTIALTTIANYHMFDISTNKLKINHSHVENFTYDYKIRDTKNPTNDMSILDTPLAQTDAIITKENKKVPLPSHELYLKSASVLPDYSIIRLERLSDSFKQGKIFVTADKNTSVESQHMLCKVIKKKFDEFSNITICLYADNQIGTKLANGNMKNVSIEDQKKYWLAMYSYNSVEGEYFDSYPSGYLGSP